MIILDFYKNVLESLDIHPDEEGLLTWQPRQQNGKPVKVMVSKLRLSLPTKHALANPEGLCIYHPLCENVAYGKSPVLEATSKFVGFSLNSVWGPMLLIELLDAITDVKRQHKLDAKVVSEITKGTSGVDEKFHINVMKILASKQANSNGIYHVFLKRGAHKGVQAARTCVITSPLLEEVNDLEGDDTTVYGVKLRKKDIEPLRKLLRYLLPEDAEYVATGSQSNEAPFFNALLWGYLKVSKHINHMLQQLKVKDAIPTDYAEHMEMFGRMAGMIPQQAHNAGIPPKGVSEKPSVPMASPPDLSNLNLQATQTSPMAQAMQSNLTPMERLMAMQKQQKGGVATQAPAPVVSPWEQQQQQQTNPWGNRFQQSNNPWEQQQPQWSNTQQTNNPWGQQQFTQTTNDPWSNQNQNNPWG